MARVLETPNYRLSLECACVHFKWSNAHYKTLILRIGTFYAAHLHTLGVQMRTIRPYIAHVNETQKKKVKKKVQALEYK